MVRRTLQGTETPFKEKESAMTLVKPESNDGSSQYQHAGDFLCPHLFSLHHLESWYCQKQCKLGIEEKTKDKLGKQRSIHPSCTLYYKPAFCCIADEPIAQLKREIPFCFHDFTSMKIKASL